MFYNRYTVPGAIYETIDYHDEDVKNLINLHLNLSGCKQCDSKLELRRETREIGYGDTLERTLGVCRDCGWWSLAEIRHNIFDEDGGADKFDSGVFEGIIKTYSINEDVPLQSLRRHLIAHSTDIHKIPASRFELIVADVYKDFYECEVRHVGGPGDNGVDAYAIIADIPHLIQVKRRASPTAVEPVATVRDLIGTLILQGEGRGVIVTTADHFSPAAQRSARDKRLERHNIQIDLKTRHDLYSMLQIANRNMTAIWEQIFAAESIWSFDPEIGR